VARHEDSFLIALPYGEHTDWLRNVLAEGSATIVTGGHSYEVDKPEVVAMSEVTGYFGPSEQRMHRIFGVNSALRISRTVTPLHITACYMYGCRSPRAGYLRRPGDDMRKFDPWQRWLNGRHWHQMLVTAVVALVVMVVAACSGFGGEKNAETKSRPDAPTRAASAARSVGYKIMAAVKVICPTRAQVLNAGSKPLPADACIDVTDYEVNGPALAIRTSLPPSAESKEVAFDIAQFTYAAIECGDGIGAKFDYMQVIASDGEQLLPRKHSPNCSSPPAPAGLVTQDHRLILRSAASGHWATADARPLQ
jgi:hypothetical protein